MRTTLAQAESASLSAEGRRHRLSHSRRHQQHPAREVAGLAAVEAHHSIVIMGEGIRMSASLADILGLLTHVRFRLLIRQRGSGPAACPPASVFPTVNRRHRSSLYGCNRCRHAAAARNTPANLSSLRLMPCLHSSDSLGPVASHAGRGALASGPLYREGPEGGPLWRDTGHSPLKHWA